MSRFFIECPACHRFLEARTGLFARKNLTCPCGNAIDVKADRMISRTCPFCGNAVLVDQAKGDGTRCPACGAALTAEGNMSTLVHFRCKACGCEMEANRDAVTVTCLICGATHDVQTEIKLAAQRTRGIPTVIRYEGDNRTFVWKHPVTDFVMGTQLVVHESQEAIFFRNGVALDSFPPGRYTLDTGELPRMQKLYPLPLQGQPFHAEVYFVNMTTQMGIRWGTNSKISLLDPSSGLHVELGASGTFNMRVDDARKLVTTLVGTTDTLTRLDNFDGASGYFRELVMTKVKSNLARIIRAEQIPVLEVDEHIDQISELLRDAINIDLKNYGLIMPEFYVSNILMPEDENFLRLKQQHADMYLRPREEQIRKAEAEAALARKSVEAQTEARMKVISAEADAQAYRMKAEAEALEMRLKGYTYQQETNRQVAVEAVRNQQSGMVGNMTGAVGSAMQIGLGIGAAGSVIDMTRDALNAVKMPIVPISQPVSEGWTCACGKGGITSNFCPDCGAKKPEASWTCGCGKSDITSNFCPDCGAKRP